MLSYLLGVALDWFKPELLYSDRANLPAWMVSFPLFIQELQENFGHFDQVGDAEFKLGKLKMNENDWIIKYNMHFNQYAAMVEWDDKALYFFYQKGLALRIKEELKHVPEKTLLKEFKIQCSKIDNKYWIFENEKKELNWWHEVKVKIKGKTPSTSTTTTSSSIMTSTSSTQGSSNKKQLSGSTLALKKNSANTKTPKPYAGVLGQDSKLLESKKIQCREQNLCSFCGGKHKWEDCNKWKMANEAKAWAGQVAKVKPNASKQEK